MFPSQLTGLSEKEALLKAYKGKKVSELPTPSFLIDRRKVVANVAAMYRTVDRLGCTFRAHVKTHKTTEGTLIQLADGQVKKVIVSTMPEAWGLADLCKSGQIQDLLYSMPVAESRIEELAEFSKNVTHLRLMLDDLDQLKALVQYSKKSGYSKKWSFFVKMNMGSDRAGYTLESEELIQVLKLILTDPEVSKFTELYGFYCHAGHSYSCHTKEETEKVLEDEVAAANQAAKLALDIVPGLDLVLSVGATPTAHAATLYHPPASQNGKLEMHAGNYPFCDLQQVGTGCSEISDVAISVLAEIVSSYPGRRGDPGEMLCNAGVLALGREFSVLPGFGKVIAPENAKNWIIGRHSQEHGILTVADTSIPTKMLPYGTKIQIIPQHSCISAAMFPWYAAIEDGVVVDIWVPWRGW